MYTSTGYLTYTCLKSFTSRLMRMSNTLAAKGTHCVLPEVWRQRFIRRAVEYSSPYMVRSVLVRYSDTSQQISPRSRRVLRMTSLGWSCCFLLDQIGFNGFRWIFLD